MDSPSASAARLVTARHCLEELCNVCYLKDGMDDDDIVLMNLSEIVWEALDYVSEDKPFSFDRLREICDTSLQETQLDKFAYAFSTLLQMLIKRIGSLTPEVAQPQEMPTSSTDPTSMPLADPLVDVKEENLDDFSDVKDEINQAIKEELGEDYLEEMDEDVAGPSHSTTPYQLTSNGYSSALDFGENTATATATVEATSKTRIWVRPRDRKNEEPVKCKHCEEYAIPGTEMAAHMTVCHPELVQQLRAKYERPTSERGKPPPPKQAKMSAELRDQYSSYSTRYEPKAPKPRRGMKNALKTSNASEASTSKEPLRRKEASKKTSRPCAYCDCPIADSTRRDDHTRKEHPMEWIRDVTKCSEPACDYRSMEPVLLRKHEEAFVKQHKIMASFQFYTGTQCPHCAAIVTTLADYNAHMEEKHPLQHLSPLNILRCATCMGKFSRIGALANHWVISRGKCVPVIEFDAIAVERCNKFVRDMIVARRTEGREGM